ncbi:hypothetical protein LJC11_04815 [Bacteroidales bacterium OttesenSCG-928-I21]|nr:hypothetical protein [Bacteroidales bacterium OttesenSCG-928-I21]
MKQNKTMTIFLTVFMGICLIGIIFMSIKNRKQRQSILQEGIETVGCVIDRGKGTGDGGMTVFSVHFDFYINNEFIIGYQQLSGSNEYERAIIGMKYKVKYLPEKPNINSIIFINAPIQGEYKNIEKERERIRATYKSGNSFLKRARPIEEIEHLFR